MLTPPLAQSGGVQAALELWPIALAAALYLRRARALARGGHAVPRWRRSCFLAGLALIGAALTGLGGLADELLYAHMIEHLLVGDLGALLLVLGLSGPLLAPVLRVRAFERLRVLTHPAVAFPLWAIDLYVWHLPSFYEGALRHSGVHALEHAMFIALGANMWMCLFGPLPAPSWFGNLGRLIYIFAVRVTGAVLGNVFAWSGSVFYPIYIHGDGAHHISPLADQNLAGAVMMVEGSVLTLGLFCWLFLRAARESEERQELLDYASAHGLELTETRAARAVAAGRGSHLRRRLGGAGGAGEEQRSRLRDRGSGS